MKVIVDVRKASTPRHRRNAIEKMKIKSQCSNEAGNDGSKKGMSLGG